MSGEPFRKGTPIESPESRRKRHRNSHNFLSPINTLDRKPEDKEQKSKPLAVGECMFPLRLNNMPSSYSKRATAASLDSLSLSMGFTDGSLLTVTESKEKDKPACTDNSNSDCDNYFKLTFNQSEKEKEDTSDDQFSFKNFTKKNTTTASSASSSPVVKSGFKSILLSCIQYRLFVIPPTKTIYSYEDLKLTFYDSDRFFLVSANVNGNVGKVVVHYSKVARIQFIRSEGSCSSDWYMDFVLTNGTVLDFSCFKCFDDPDIENSCMTLRVVLAKRCGGSLQSLENILLSIVRDRRAFYFTSTRDRYGEFELSDSSSSPSKPASSKQCTLTRSYSREKSPPRYRFISESTESIPKWPITAASPDVFDSAPRRTSKRLKGNKSQKRTFDEGSFTYVDPDFESERVKLFSYPEGEVDSIQVTSHELERLEPGIWLNDTLIDFELKFLFHHLDKSLQEKVHIFNSFFYRRLSSEKISLTLTNSNSNANEKSGFDLVKSWSRKVNLFEKDFIVIPINENLHWFLAVICYPSRILSSESEPITDEETDSTDLRDECIVDLSESSNENTQILIFDSLGLTTKGKSTGVINRLRTYLQLEARDKLNRPASRSQCSGHVVKVPQQENYTDCGCFLLQFVEEFFKGIPQGLVQNLPDSSYNLSEWFPSAIGQSRRQVMKERIKALAEDYAMRVQHKPESVESDSSDIEEIVMYVKNN